jgi:hypothetical protein
VAPKFLRCKDQTDPLGIESRVNGLGVHNRAVEIVVADAAGCMEAFGI